MERVACAIGNVALSAQKNTGALEDAAARMIAEPDCGFDTDDGLGFSDESDTMYIDPVMVECMVEIEEMPLTSGGRLKKKRKGR